MRAISHFSTSHHTDAAMLETRPASAAPQAPPSTQAAAAKPKRGAELTVRAFFSHSKISSKRGGLKEVATEWKKPGNLTCSPARLKQVTQDLMKAHRLSSKKVDLRGIGLETLPSAIGNLDMVRELDLSNNQIKDVPAEVAKLPRMEFLDLSGNKLTSVPAELLVPRKKLLTIVVRGNPLASLPEHNPAKIRVDWICYRDEFPTGKAENESLLATMGYENAIEMSSFSDEDMSPRNDISEQDDHRFRPMGSKVWMHQDITSDNERFDRAPLEIKISHFRLAAIYVLPE